MGYKTILVHVDTGKRRRARIDHACTLATKCGAHLVGMFAVEPQPAPIAPEAEDCGAKVLVPWNFSREAARAMYDGLPFLGSARAVEVVTFDPEKLSRPIELTPPPDLRSYLSRHDIAARMTEQPSGGIDIGSAILSHAADTGADLIVAGAYSHSRARELILGGATRKLFKSMTVPTLMSH